MAIALGWDYLSQEMKVHKICLNNGCIWQTQNVVNINLKEKRRKEKKKRSDQKQKDGKRSKAFKSRK